MADKSKADLQAEVDLLEEEVGRVVEQRDSLQERVEQLEAAQKKAGNQHELIETEGPDLLRMADDVSWLKAAFARHYGEQPPTDDDYVKPQPEVVGGRYQGHDGRFHDAEGKIIED